METVACPHCDHGYVEIAGKKKGVFLVAVKVLPSEVERDNVVRLAMERVITARKSNVRNVTAPVG